MSINLCAKSVSSLLQCDAERAAARMYSAWTSDDILLRSAVGVSSCFQLLLSLLQLPSMRWYQF
jgi:hypothetical protein